MNPLTPHFKNKPKNPYQMLSNNGINPQERLKNLLVQALLLCLF
ncbi:hypothetical protein HPNQ4053_0888 [Helicobacter pylori NQ4053]|uniref:CagY like domain protein n=1 Tax=Helicobacter pylori NQ4053 TaxID=992027 RepID=I9QL47_HELPX|nr:hypothetical protein HPNQ4053_0888 [Helicobacter pylori NQ4053]